MCNALKNTNADFRRTKVYAFWLILQEDKSIYFFIDMNLSVCGQQRIELGSFFCVASAGRSDFTLF